MGSLHLLAKLPHLNWEELIVKKTDENSLRSCDECHELKDARTFSEMLKHEGFRVKSLRICPECTTISQFNAVCSICSDVYPALSIVSKFTCRRCKDICDLVATHNLRAKRLNLPATLTPSQWFSTIRYFDNKCAYCEGVYECLEHYLSLTLNGGTTIDNCVPSCLSCNVRKREYHPDSLHDLFPLKNLARIQAYLESQRKEVA